jgi:hypothetical protein
VQAPPKLLTPDTHNLPLSSMGAVMGIYGVDIHPRFQAGIGIEEIRREGFDFMAVKVSEGLDGSYLAAGSADFLRRGRAAGLLCLGYHYLHADDEDIQGRYSPRPSAPPEYPACSTPRPLPLTGASRP